MAAKKKCDSIALFYKLNHKKGKSYTFHLFKNCGLSRKGIYKDYLEKVFTISLQDLMSVEMWIANLDLVDFVQSGRLTKMEREVLPKNN